jgi:hypothetical protein
MTNLSNLWGDGQVGRLECQFSQTRPALRLIPSHFITLYDPVSIMPNESILPDVPGL